MDYSAGMGACKECLVTSSRYSFYHYLCFHTSNCRLLLFNFLLYLRLHPLHGRKEIFQLTNVFHPCGLKLCGGRLVIYVCICNFGSGHQYQHGEFVLQMFAMDS